MVDPLVCRSFVRTKDAWYAQLPGTLDLYTHEEVTVHVEAADISGEFAVRWQPVGNTSAPRLEAFDDAWGVLHHVADLLEAMAARHGKNISPPGFLQPADPTWVRRHHEANGARPPEREREREQARNQKSAAARPAGPVKPNGYLPTIGRSVLGAGLFHKSRHNFYINF